MVAHWPRKSRGNLVMVRYLAENIQESSLFNGDVVRIISTEAALFHLSNDIYQEEMNMLSHNLIYLCLIHSPLSLSVVPH